MNKLPNQLEHRFVKAVKELNEILMEARLHEPGANYYLAADVLNLLSGPSHDDTGAGREVACQDRVLISDILFRSGGGDW